MNEAKPLPVSPLLPLRGGRDTIPTKIYPDLSFPVLYRKPQSLQAPAVRYPGFQPGRTLLKKGTIRRHGARPLACDILFERDVPVSLRDGVVIYTDIFRAADNNPGPAIIAWSPYGKELGGQWLDDLPERVGVPLDAVSELQKWEGPDPAYWVSHGYVIVNPDVRGAYSSGGNISFLGRQTGEDGYDLVEWCAAQPWSTGKVAFSGNSWLGFAQWVIAAEQPPHLTCIAPWEGLTDLYRDVLVRGGIPQPFFFDLITQSFAGRNSLEDPAAMAIEYPLMNDYWQEKIARLDRIEVPAYIVASYTNGLHVHGTFEGYRRIASTEKWLRVHNSQEWPDYYKSENVEDLRRFFDCYMKGIDNGWRGTPKVRLAVLDPGGTDTVDRAEGAFPLARTEYRRLYLTANRALSWSKLRAVSQISYEIEGAEAPLAAFEIVFEQETEITGYMNLKLWVEAVGSHEMDLAVTVLKLGKDGEPLTINTSGGSSFDPILVKGFLRVSLREIDHGRSTPSEPFLTYRNPQALKPDEVVPVEIGLWPTALRFHRGETLQLTVAAFKAFAFPIQFGAVPVPVPADGATFEPGAEVALQYLGGPPDPTAAEYAVPIPGSVNRGRHIIHFGGEYDSHLLVPLIPERS
jgi:predicted acyl esterase